MMKKEEHMEGEEGPPPGWQSDEIIVKRDSVEEQHDEDLPPGWQSRQIEIKQDGVEEKIDETSPQGLNRDQIVAKQESVEEDDDEGPPPGWQTIPSSSSDSPLSETPSDEAEMAQMVCGSCHLLLSYPKGARYVHCSSCEADNFVLEANEVGQVICGGCTVLLMYPYGAPSVKCSSCLFVTDIGQHNKRPALSDQQGTSLSAQLRQLNAPPH